MSTSINLLPVEILNRIFSYVRDLRAGFDEGFTFIEGFPVYDIEGKVSEWLTPFTLVCHHWRLIALSNRPFWRDVHLKRGGEHIAQIYLERSSPLTIRLFMDPPKEAQSATETLISVAQTSFWARLGEEIGRVEEVILRSTFEQFPEASDIFQQAPFLNLRTLKFACGESPLSQEIEGKITAPNLQSLALSDIRTIPSQLLPNLTHFSLSNGVSNCRLGDFLPLLRSMPKLARLIIINALPSASFSAPNDGLDPVWMPNLKDLYLSDGTMPSDLPVLLFHKLRYPADTRVQWFDTFGFRINRAPPPWSLDKITVLLLSSGVNSMGASCIQHNIALLGTGYRNSTSQFSGHFRNVRILLRPMSRPLHEWADGLHTVEEYHTDLLNIYTVELLTRLEQPHPIFPNLQVLVFWKDFTQPTELIFRTPTSQDSYRELCDVLEKDGRTTRSRSDGSTYSVELREKVPDTFSFDWLISNFKSQKAN